MRAEVKWIHLPQEKYLVPYNSEHYNDIQLWRALLHGVIFLMNGFAKLNVQIQRDIIQTHTVF